MTEPYTLTLLGFSEDVTFLTRLNVVFAILTAPVCILLLGRTRIVTVHLRSHDVDK